MIYIYILYLNTILSGRVLFFFGWMDEAMMAWMQKGMAAMMAKGMGKMGKSKGYATPVGGGDLIDLC